MTLRMKLLLSCTTWLTILMGLLSVAYGAVRVWALGRPGGVSGGQEPDHRAGCGLDRPLRAHGGRRGVGGPAPVRPDGTCLRRRAARGPGGSEISQGTRRRGSVRRTVHPV